MTCEWEKLSDGVERCTCCGLKLRSPKHPIRHKCTVAAGEFFDDELRRVPFQRRLANFSKALAAHAAAGFPTVSQEVIDARLAVCRVCELFTGEVCAHADCGCNVNDMSKFLNKLSWADQACPLGKWRAEQ